MSEAVSAGPRFEPSAGERLRIAVFPTGETAGARAEQGRRKAPWLLPFFSVATAALVLLAPLVLLSRDPWQITDIEGDGLVLVDGVAYAAQNPKSWRPLLGEGVDVEISNDVTLTLGNAKNCEIVATPGTRLTFPKEPGRWFNRDVAIEVRRGAVHATTGPTFTGSRLRFVTPEAEVTVTGTTLSVARREHITCVCVLEGKVEVHDRTSGLLFPVSAGRRLVLTDRAHPPVGEKISGGERMKLAATRATTMKRLFD